MKRADSHFSAESLGCLAVRDGEQVFVPAGKTANRMGYPAAKDQLPRMTHDEIRFAHNLSENRYGRDTQFYPDTVFIQRPKARCISRPAVDVTSMETARSQRLRDVVQSTKRLEARELAVGLGDLPLSMTKSGNRTEPPS